MSRLHACATALFAISLLSAGCTSDPAALAYSEANELGPSDIMARLDLTKEQETLVWPVIRRRLIGQSIMLSDARNGEAQAEIARQLEKERHDADIALDDVLNTSQWAEWTRVQDQLGAQVLAAR